MARLVLSGLVLSCPCIVSYCLVLSGPASPRRVSSLLLSYLVLSSLSYCLALSCPALPRLA
eukprot:4910801-Lingulodinium_polyedra.AAC.1